MNPVRSLRRPTSWGHGIALVVLLAGCVDELAPSGVGSDAIASEPLFGRSGFLASELESPVRVTSTRKSGILVSDSKAGAVYALDPVTLQPTTGFQVRGQPLGLTGMGNRIYVGNTTDRTVDAFNRRGRYKGSFGPVGKPVAMDADEDAKLLFVLDADAGHVTVFDRKGRTVRVLSGPGPGPDQLLIPTGLAVDEAGDRVFVADWGDQDGGNAAIKIFDYAGTYVGEISGRGDCGMLGCTGGFSKPQGMEIMGRLFVTDVILAEVLVFDLATLEQVATLGGRDAVPNLRTPLGVAANNAGDVFVASNGTGRVEVIRGGAR